MLMYTSGDKVKKKTALCTDSECARREIFIMLLMLSRGLRKNSERSEQDKSKKEDGLNGNKQ